MQMRSWVHHIDLTVSDLERSGSFYDAVLGFLGYRRGHENGSLIVWNMGEAEYPPSVAIRLARNKRKHDRYTCGLHHLAFVADTRAAVDELHQLLVHIGATVLDPPSDYPQYRKGYYAVFFTDPDGLKLEYVHTP